MACLARCSATMAPPVFDPFLFSKVMAEGRLAGVAATDLGRSMGGGVSRPGAQLLATRGRSLQVTAVASVRESLHIFYRLPGGNEGGNRFCGDDDRWLAARAIVRRARPA